MEVFSLIWYNNMYLQRSLPESSLSLHRIKSNQITFIITSPQHKCLGEWNSNERAPDSAKKTKNKTQQFTYGQYIWILYEELFSKML